MPRLQTHNHMWLLNSEALLLSGENIQMFVFLAGASAGSLSSSDCVNIDEEGTKSLCGVTVCLWRRDVR